MLSNNRILRLVLFAAPVLALTAAALVLAFGPGSGGRAQAGSALNFALAVDFNGDGTNDCGTGAPSAVGDGAPDPVSVDVSNTNCAAVPGATLQVNVYLMNAGGLAYSAAAAQIYFTGGVASSGPGDAVWAGCVFEVSAPVIPGLVNTGCAIGLPPAATPQTNLGLLNRFSFTCTAGGTLRLGHALGETGLTDDALQEHVEVGGTDELTVCGGGEPTDTPVPTNTPGPTAVPTTPGPTATTGPTNTPTNTVPPTATRTPTPTRESQLGDVNGDGVVDAEDALWILWDEAGIEDVPLPEKADVNEDGEINSIDALFILWRVGGQI